MMEEWKDIITWGAVAINLGSFIMGGFTMLRYHKMSRKLFAEQVAFDDAQVAWWTEQAKWLDNRKARIMARYERREAKRYLAELNRLQEISDTMSSKISSSMYPVEKVG